MSLGTNLEKLRKDHKISQKNLGDLLGLTQQMISSYENDLSSPNAEILWKIADFFNVSIDSLVGRTSNTQELDPSEARLLQYFKHLKETDREKSILIIQTLLQDRGLNQ